jgi:hypothetical protein
MRRARQLAEQLADELAGRAGAGREGPLDVEAVALRLGLAVSYDEIRQDGRFLPGPYPTIIVKRAQHAARQRFTIAHELAHWAVWEDHPLAAQVRDEFSSEEMLCNTVAAALLMPRGWVWERFKKDADEPGMAVVQGLAGEAGVSLGAAVIRLRDVFAWDKTLLHWSRSRGEWVFDGEAGVYPWEEGAIVPSSNVSFVLNDVRNGGAGVQRRLLTLRVFREEREVVAELLPQRNGVAVLIDAPEALERRWRGSGAA